ncbi:MAG: hypothetical protein M1381_02530, partial [Deltaproteobacteria bacterium]|nr:hypothetical protein [Deltaproteobacteria bacterium]
MRFIKRGLPYLIVFLVSFLYLSHFTHYLFATNIANDEGEMAGAWRLLHGQVIYRDFPVIYAPGNFFLLAIIYKLFGYSLVVTNKALIVLDILDTILLYHISNMIIKKWYAIVPPLVYLVVSLPTWFFFSHYWTTTFTLFVSMILLMNAFERAEKEAYNNMFFFLSGFFVGLTGIFLQSAGVYATVVLFIVFYFKIKNPKGIIKQIIIFSTGIAVPVLSFVSYLLLNKAFMPFIYDQFVLLKLYSATVWFLSKPFMSLYNIMTPLKLML